MQALIELGSYAYALKPIEDLIPGHESWSNNNIARFMVPKDAADIKFSDKLYRQMNQWLQTGDHRLICVYGEYDPWTAAAPDKSYFEGKTNMSIYIKKRGVALIRHQWLDSRGATAGVDKARRMGKGVNQNRQYTEQLNG